METEGIGLFLPEPGVVHWGPMINANFQLLDHGVVIRRLRGIVGNDPVNVLGKLVEVREDGRVYPATYGDYCKLGFCIQQSSASACLVVNGWVRANVRDSDDVAQIGKIVCYEDGGILTTEEIPGREVGVILNIEREQGEFKTCFIYLFPVTGLSGSGVQNHLVKWVTPRLVGSSVIVEEDNKIGIGVLSPTERLVVAGNIGIRAGSNAFIGTIDNNALGLRTNNIDRIYITTDGRVGIGTTSVNAFLHVATDLTVERVLIDAYNDSPASGGSVVGRKARGSKDAPSAVLSGDVLTGLYGSGYNGTGFSPYVAAIRFLAADNFTSSSNPTKIEFATTGVNQTSRTVRMLIDQNGNVGIGTTTPSTKLHVAGAVQLSDGTYASAILGNSYNYFTYVGGTTGGRIRGSSGEGYLVVESYPSGTNNRLYLNHSSPGHVIIAHGGGSVGIGTYSPNSKLHVAGPIATAITTKTSDYTLTNVDSTVLVNASSGPVTINLPSAAGITGRIYTIKKIDNSANSVTIDAYGNETIDGSLTYSLSAQWKYVTVQSDGSKWYIIANN